MKKIIEKINLILTDWDPMSVGREMASDEYRSYIPSIIRNSKDIQELMNCLEDILLNKI